MNELASELTERGIELFVENGRLRFRSEVAPDPAVLDNMRSHRTELLDELETTELSAGQAALWFLWTLDPDSLAYNTAFCARLNGHIDREVLESSLGELSIRHSALRSTFQAVEGRPIRRASAGPLELTVQDVEGWSTERIDSFVAGVADKPFDLLLGPVARCHLLQNAGAPGDALLLFAAHHIVVDFRSLEILFSELSELYGASIEGRPSGLPGLTATWADYVRQERHWLNSADGLASAQWWIQKLGGELPVLHLPTDHPRPSRQQFAGATRSFILGDDLARALRAFAIAEGVTVNVALLSAFTLLLSRFSRTNETLVGAPMLGRRGEQWENSAGYFVNPVVLRFRPESTQSAQSFLQEVRTVVLEGIEHQYYPFPLLVEAINPDRDPSRSPIFQVAFVYERKLKAATNLIREVLWGGQRGSVFDLTLTALDEADSLRLNWEYATSLFLSDTIRNLHEHFCVLLQSLLRYPERACGDLSILTADDLAFLAARTPKATHQAEQAETTLLEIFDARCRMTPDAPAVDNGEQVWSYAELNRFAESFADQLGDQGVSRNTPVGLFLARGFASIAMIFAIMKAGGTCVPLDLESPPLRLLSILEESRLSLIVSSTLDAERLPACDVPILLVDAAPARPTPGRSRIRSMPDDILYVLYTSGSTGKPKGVAMPHAAIVNLVHWQATVHGLDQQARVLQYTPLTFDVSFQEIATTFATGGTMVLIDEWARRDSEHLLKFLAEQRIERLFLPFVALQALADAANGDPLPTPLQHVITAGEQLRITPAIRRLFRASAARLHNHYGPTESHVATALVLDQNIDAWEDLPAIGQPISNVGAYVLDERGGHLPPGIAGELYLGGVCLAADYHRRADLTAERFIQHPELGRLYRTGDIVAWRLDGTLVYRGRVDNQIKIRGHRVELEEIEAVLSCHPDVLEAAVRIYTRAGELQLAGYVCSAAPPAEGNAAFIARLNAFLQDRLPRNMIPASLTILERLPKNRNGKIDRGALPDPETNATEVETLPRTEVERLVATVWQSLLGLEQAGVHTSFFAQGGHSLVAIRLFGRLREIFHVDLPLRTIFDYPTIAGLAEQIEARAMSTREALPALPADTPPILSFGQERLWYLDQLEGPSAAYHLAADFELLGDFSVDAMRQAALALVERHDSLRYRFPSDAGVPKVELLPVYDPLKFTNLSTLSEAEQNEEGFRLSGQSASEPIDLACGPLLRFHCVRMGAGKHRLLIAMHHIVSDAWSLGVFARELGELYAAATESRSPNLPCLTSTYAAYAASERVWMNSDAAEHQLNYWRGKLAGAPAAIRLPIAKPRSERRTYQGGVHTRALPRRFKDSVDLFNSSRSSTTYITLLTALNILLWRYSGQADLPIGAVIANRGRTEFEHLIGLFTNTLVLRTQLDPADTFESLACKVRQTCLDAFSHGELPFERLVQALHPDRNLSHNPLFQICCVLLNEKTDNLNLAGVESRALHAPLTTAKFDLVLYIEELHDSLRLIWEYDANLFEASQITRLAEHFDRLLQSALERPELPIQALKLLTTEEMIQQGRWSLGPQRALEYECVMEAFEAACDRTPDATAVSSGEGSISFSDLNDRANRLARHLQSHGAAAGQIVALLLPPSVDLIVAILAVCKSGAAYLPLDPSYPAARLSLILEDSRAGIIVSLSALAAVLNQSNGYLCLIDRDAASIALFDGANLPLQAGPDDLVYVIYTSGSTGTPKGAAVFHRGFANLLQWYAHTLNLKPQDDVLMLSAIGFDLTQKNVFATMVSGGTLHLPTWDEFDPAQISQSIRAGVITVINCTPSAFYPLIDYPEDLAALRWVVLGGEPIQSARVAPWLQRVDCKATVLNSYGPTECTDICAAWSFDACSVETSIPMGRPIDNVEVWLLDTNLQPVPAEVPGDLWIAGAGVGYGYIQRDELNRASFQSVAVNGKSMRMYRTGDLARWRPDGVLEYLGRGDEQVKLRGFRFELGEIESSLSKLAGVHEAAVVLQGEGDDRKLVAFITGEFEGSPAELRRRLEQELPAYMVPSRIQPIDALPLTAHGKVDRLALRGRVLGQEEPRISHPLNETERILERVWCDLLGRQAIDVEATFFANGGHSLLATRLAARLESEFSVYVPLRELYKRPTLREFAGWIESQRAEPDRDAPAALQPRPEGEPLVLSFAQRRLWILDQLGGGSEAYSMPSVLEVEGDLDESALRRALQFLVERHSMLRLAVASVEGAPEPFLLSPFDPLIVSDVRHSSTPEAEAQSIVDEEVRKPFVVAEGPLFRAHLLRLRPGVHWLLFNMHHMISDGWSVDILIRELSEGYLAFRSEAQPNLPPLSLDYPDYAAWQRRSFSSEALERQLEGWKGALEGAPQTLDLPTDLPRPATAGGPAGEVLFQLDSHGVTSLAEIAASAQATLFMALLAAFNVLLHRCTGQSDLCVGIPVTNRSHIELDPIVGLFLNTLVIRTRIASGASFLGVLAEVRDAATAAYGRQDIQFEYLVEQLSPERSLARHPLFSVMLNLVNTRKEQPRLEGCVLRELHTMAGRQAKFDLSLSFAPGDDGSLGASLEYNASLFNGETAEFLGKYFVDLAAAIADSPSVPLSQITLFDVPPETLAAQPAVATPAVAFGRIDSSIGERFADQARRHGSRIAARSGTSALSYAELDLAARQLAAAIAAVETPGPVALLLAMDTAVPIGMLGTLMAGRQYIPLDPTHPDGRLIDILEQSEAAVVVCSTTLASRATGLARPGVKVLDVEQGTAIPLAEPVATNPDSIAYLLYTSGSTGKPKGVVQNHRNVLHFMRVYAEKLHIVPEDHLLQIASYASDAGLMDIFGALLNGATLCLFDLHSQGIEELLRWIEDEHISIYHSTPTVLRLVTDAAKQPLPSIRLVILGGETALASDFDAYRRIFPADSVFVNGLGPTESTIALQQFLTPQSALTRHLVPVGFAVPETAVTLVDADGTPADLFGEIVIHSPYVALCYWKEESDRFGEDLHRPGQRFYRTADMGRRLPSGAVEFLGRRDHQIKLRGFRIELGEIEAVLRKEPGVQDAAAVLWPSSGPATQPRLIAYVVGNVHEPTLYLRLRHSLPDYMVPGAIVVVAALPRLVNGKVDRRGLPEPSAVCLVEEQAPVGAAERRLAGLWSEVLGVGVEAVGRGSHFFALGGNSLVAIQLISRVRESFSAAAPLRLIFDAPRLGEQAAALDALSAPAEEAIARLAPGEPLPLSFAQERLWFLDQMGAEGGAAAYAIHAALWLEGGIEEQRLRQALFTLTERQASLRMNFFAEHGVARLRLRPAYDPLLREELGTDGMDVEASIREHAARHAALAFDLAHDALFRITLVGVAEDRAALLFSMHHIIGDGWSLGLLVRELGALYAGQRLAPLPIAYPDFAAWQRRRLAGQELERLLGFWRGQLEGAPELLELPADHARPAVKSYRGGQIGQHIPSQLTAELAALGAATGATLFMTLLAAFAVLLHRLSGQTDLVIGSPVAERQARATEAIVGLFVNTIALRVRLDPALCWRDLLAQVRTVALDAYAHQEMPFEKLVDEIQPRRSLSHSPLFQVALALQSTPAGPLQLGETRVRPIDCAGVSAKFDLLLNLELRDGALEGVWEYSADLFEAATIERLAGRFEHLLQTLVRNPDQSIATLDLLPEAERRQLAGWSGAMVAYPRESPVAALFSEQARLEPGATAVRFGADSMTYAQLEARAASLARHLRGLGVKDGEPVLLAMERSPWMIVAMLAVLGAGGAYVPLNPGDPEQRLRHILAETRASILLTTSETMLPELDASTLLLDTLQLEFAASPWIQAQTSGSDPAYIMFTSGSTGQPKGVVVPHRAITRLVRNTNFCRLTAGMRVAQVSSPAFDAATFEIWGALLNGATLHLTGREELLDPDRFLGSLRVGEVDVLFLTTALFNRFAALDPGCFRGLDYLLFGGEAVDPRSVRAVLSGGAPRHLLHVYGPTESTTFSTFHQVESVEGGTVPIGLPIANTQVWVVDGNGREQPLGVPGEIVIGGDGLALGYLHQPELTAEKFVTLAELGRVYTSGDIGRRRADGAIEFLGRRDHQIKLRGFRIEPGEIEAALRRLPGVREAVVDVRGQDEHRYLAAWVEARGLTPDQMLDQLRLQLPGFLIPARILMLDTLPLNVNGKVDRRGLPEPSAVCLVEEQAPVGAAERRLAGLWSEVLGVGVEAVGRGSHFFALGGNSLVAIQLISRVRESFSAAAPLRLIFDAPRLGEQAAALDALSAPAEEAIARLAPGEPLPLSFAQERLWFLDQMGAEGGAAAYAIHAALWLEGGIEEQRLRQALFTLTERQASLRMNFFAEHGVARLRLRPAYDPLLREELGTDGMDVEASIREHAARHAALAFDLAHDALFRITLVGVAEDRAALLFSMHHIIGDGWSLGLLVRELGALYAGQRLAPLPIAYPDFAAWQRRRLAGQELERLLGFWRGQLEGAPELLELPADHARPAVKSYRGGQIGQHIPSQLTAELAALGAATGATLFMTLLAAFAVLLHRLSGQTDLVIGSPVAERQARATEAIVGLFVNTIALRVRLDPALCWRDLLAQVRTVALDAYAHQEMPFEKLVDEIQPRRSLSHSPLFQVALALQSTPAGPLQLGETRVRPIDCAGVSAKFDLLLNLELRDGALEGVWEYSADLFEAATIERLAGRFEHLLQTLVRNPDQSIATLDLLPEAERRQLAGWSGAMVAYPRESPVAALFSEQARLEPGATAVRFGADSMTYAQLEARAASLARHLRGLGVKDGEPVLLAMERSPWMIVAMLAVLGAGGAYVPLNPGDPEQRLRHILAETRASILLTTSETMLPELDASTLLLDTLQLEFAASPWIQAQTSGSDPAYIMFTSGSTGQPKGVVVPHRAITRLVRNTNFCRFTPADVFLQFAPAAFDAATFEIWGPLLNGATLVLSPPGALASDLPHLIAAYQVTTLWLTAGLFHLVVDHFLHGLRGLHTLLAGGDVLSPDHVRRALRALPGCTLVNGYGPTENTTFTTCFPMQDPDALQQPIPIGFPIPNTRVWVLDDHNREQPIGVPGEIVIGGDGLALGYLHQPQFTAEKFLTLDEFGRVYKSGDIGRFRPDGALEFLGRSDNQIKLRGYRIEPGEIEAALRQIPQVQDAAVDLRGHDEHRYLAAWVAAKGITPDQMLDQLRLQLPAFLIPANITVLDTLPINHNGKIDKQKLHTTSTTPATQQDIPLTHTETQLATIWKQILKIPHIQKNQNFFSLGGDSILAIRIVSRIRETLHKEVPVAALFRSPTLRMLALELDGAQRSVSIESIPRASRTEAMPLSFAQERLWFLHQLEPDNPFYNTPLALRLHGELNRESLGGALQDLTERHELLRTAFIADQGKPRQSPVAHLQVKVTEEDLCGLDPIEREDVVHMRAREEARRPFASLATPPLMRVTLLILDEQEYALLLTMHHIVVDGWSLDVLLRELTLFYNARCHGEPLHLDPLPIQYSDFALWQREWLEGERFDHMLTYWKRQLAGAPPLLALPTDFPRPALQRFRGGSVRFYIDADVRDQMQQFALTHNATLFMALLSAFAVMLHRYSRQTDMVIGSPIANRQRPELEGLIGFFVNTLALRVSLDGRDSFTGLLDRVQHMTLEAFDHQDLPFERLVDEHQPERDLSRSPIFQVMFALQNAPFTSERAEGLEFSAIQMPREAALFDVVLDVWEQPRGLMAILEYNRDLFETATAERMARHYSNLLRGLVAQPERALEDVPLMDEAEQSQVLAWSSGQVRSYPVDRSYSAAFEEQVDQTPERTAAIAGGQSITYADLNRRANRIAHMLRNGSGVLGAPVAVVIPRGIDYLAAAIGVIKAGAMLVPVDTSYPSSRITHMIEDCRCTVAISNAEGQSSLPAGLPRVAVIALASETAIDISLPYAVEVLKEWEQPATANGDAAIPTVGSDPMYMIYTSGSTGQPKGAVVRHNGALNHMYAEFRLLRFHANTAFLQSAPASSDISIWQCLGPLLVGGRCVIADYTTLCDPAALFRLIATERITLIELVPFSLDALLQHASALSESERFLPHLEWAMVTGETASPSLANRWFELWPHVPLVNAYGPTEAADDVCQHVFHSALPISAQVVPIGVPIDNMSVMVLDTSDNLAAPGIPGEICVSGIGVGAGYWNQPERTAKVFLPNLHAAVTFGETIYRTGDLGRYRNDGTLEFLGRLDHQVKIRGFRVELGEIGAALSSCPGVRDALVMAQPGPDDKPMLVAYVQVSSESTTASEAATNQVELWKDLHEKSYADGDGVHVRFNTVGWDSTYTRQPLSAAEMRECIANAVVRIRALRPQHMLEIGCGTGLLLFRLAEGCERFIGTDLAETAVNHLRAIKDGGQVLGLESLELLQRPAEDFSGIAPLSLDTIVLNSVVQYFPDVPYLLNVLRQGVERLRNGGSIFLGDVRSLALLRAYHASVQEANAADTMSAAQLREKIDAQILREQELLLDPGAFQLAEEGLPRISVALLRPKRGRIHNEMTRFRYDVVLQVGGVVPGECPREAIHDWQDGLDTIAALRHRLELEQPEYLAVRQVPNARLAREQFVLSWLSTAEASASVADLRRQIAAATVSTAIDPEDLWHMAYGLLYKVELLIEPQSPYSFAVLFTRTDSAPVRLTLNQAPRSAQWSDYTNNPLQESISRRILPQLRLHLKDRLPTHMIPQRFVVLERFPLTPAGKIDRLALPMPSLPAERSAQDSVPRNPTEQVVQQVWEEVLGFASPDIQESFFTLGGHSLKATQIVSRLLQRRMALTLRDVFNYPTIAELAAFLIGQTETEGLAPIPRVPDAPLYPASRAQQRLWVLGQMGKSSAYNITAATRIFGPLDTEALQLALQQLLLRHEILRTSFVEHEQALWQKVEAVPLPFVSFTDLRGLPDRREQVGVEARRHAQILHDLAIAPLLRVSVLQIEAQEFALLCNLHHIVSDGWSMDVLLRDFMQLYARVAMRSTESIPELPLQHRDFVAWWTERCQIREAADRAYWVKALAPPGPALELPYESPRPAIKTFAGSRHAVQLPLHLSHRLRNSAQTRNVSLATLLTALVKVLLHRYSLQEDISVGWPVACRTHPALEQQIGLYVNTVVLRSRPEANEVFSGYLDTLNEVALGALAHEEYPFDQVVQDISPARDISRNPLFDVMVALQNTANVTLSLPNLTVEPLPVETESAQFDLLWNFTDTAQGLFLDLRYNTDLFRAASAGAMVRHWQTLASNAVASPDTEIGRIPMITSEERAQLLPDRPTLAPHDTTTIVSWFSSQARTSAMAIALSDGTRNLTYADLDRQSNGLARHILERHPSMSQEPLIGIHMRRSIEQVVAILGILKAGAAYVPVDPDAPVERTRFILNDSRVEVLLTDDEDLALSTGTRIVLDRARAEALAYDTAPTVMFGPDAAAYVIYTSGSTGQPKGTIVMHRNVVRLFTGTSHWFEFKQQDVWTLFHSYAFDFSVWEIWGALLHGGRLVVVPFEVSRDPDRFYELLAHERVTILNQTPSAFRLLIRAELDRYSQLELSLRLVIFGGERLIPSQLKPWIDRHGDATPRLVNMFGITETTVHVTYRVITASDTESSLSPIGQPIPDMRLYILDPYLEPVPNGVPGELFVGGGGVARAYLYRDELSAVRFIANPFVAGDRLYRTGDQVRRTLNGELLYLGRLDQQVKIRGHRVETGEVVSVLESYPGIREAAVRVVTWLDEPTLIGYYTCSEDVSRTELQSALRRALPDYMIPTALVPIARIPLTTNGKLDERALPGPDLLDAAEAPRQPRRARSPLEEALLTIWRETLNVPHLDPDENVFHQGANSMLAVHVRRRIEAMLDREVPIVLLFQHPTIGGLAACLEAESPSAPAAGASSDRAKMRLAARQSRGRR